MNLQTAIKWKKKSKLFVSLAGRPGKTGENFYSTLFEYHNIDAEYIACECKDFLQDILLVREHCAGASITMPFKQLASQHIDRSESPNSAINTVINYSSLLVGYNCDYLGLKEVLGDRLKDQTVVVLGDGAMAENVIMLSNQACSVIQISRRKNNWDQRHTNCDVLINTTGIGMGTDQSPVDFINAHTVVDCVIGKTSLIRQAREKNKKVITGADIYQAQFKHQFKLYTHQEPDSAIVSLVAKRVFE